MRPNLLPLAKEAVYYGPGTAGIQVFRSHTFSCCCNIEVTVRIAGAEADIYRGADAATIEAVLRMLKSC